MMNHDLTVTGTIIINTPIERVWDVMTNPDIIKEYLFGTETVTGWKVGSPIIFKGAYNGISYQDHGIILEYIPLKVICYTYWCGFSRLPDLPENYATIKYLLEAKGDGLTQLQWIQSGYGSEADYRHSLSGMPGFMNQIKGIAER